MSSESSFQFIDLDAVQRTAALRYEVLGDEKPWYPVMGCRPVSSGCDHCVGLQLHNDWLRANGRPTTSSLQPPALQQPEISRVRTFAREDHVVEIGRAHVELQSLMRNSYAVFCLKKK